MSPLPGAVSAPDAHVVQLYDDRQSLVDGVTAYTGCALLHGEAALVVATPEHRAAFAAALTGGGLAVGRLRRTGQYVELDADSLLAWATGRDGRLDVPLLTGAIGDQLSELARRWHRVSVYSDLVSCLWGRGDGVATLELERSWSGLAGTRGVRLYCGYDSTDFADRGSAQDAMRLLTTHSAVRAR